MTGKLTAVLILFALLFWGCQTPQTPSTKNSRKSTSESKKTHLPKPDRSDNTSLQEALAKRKSVRSFTTEQLTENELAKILWAASGTSKIDEITGATRTAPSAGTLHPLDIYVLTKAGFFHYLASEHKLENVKDGDMRNELSLAALEQTAVEDAPVSIIISGVLKRTSVKYGKRAERYVLLEAGHAAQNILLQATALELGGVTIGAFEDSKVQEVLPLPDDHKPLYIIPLGHPDE